MFIRVLTAVAIGALVSTGAMAQTTKSSDNAQAASARNEWRASELIHMNVYNNQNEKIGDIKELMLDKSGKVANVVIGVGGFLGAGERDVAVPFSELKWVNEPARSANNQTSSTTTGSAQTQQSRGKNYPDHAVFNATKDQLKAMPQFDYNK
jgi:sporulation protein YlmC with PRC-barrel domain